MYLKAFSWLKKELRKYFFSELLCLRWGFFDTLFSYLIILQFQPISNQEVAYYA